MPGYALKRSEVELVVEHHGRYQIFPVPPGLRPHGWAAREARPAAGRATQEELERWNAGFERLDGAQPRPMMFTPLFFAFGRRPAG